MNPVIKRTPLQLQGRSLFNVDIFQKKPMSELGHDGRCQDRTGASSMYIKKIKPLYVFYIFNIDSHMLTYTNAD